MLCCAIGPQVEGKHTGTLKRKAEVRLGDGPNSFGRSLSPDSTLHPLQHLPASLFCHGCFQSYKVFEVTIECIGRQTEFRRDGPYGELFNAFALNLLESSGEYHTAVGLCRVSHKEHCTP